MVDHFITCPLCEATCGLQVTVEAGEVKRIRGDQDDVFSAGFICPKGSTLKQLQADPDRVLTPLVRNGTGFEPVSWDDAFAAIADRLGPVLESGDKDAIAIYHGNPTVHGTGSYVYREVLAGAAGTRNVFSSSTLDQMPKHVSSGLMFGDPNLFTIPDIDRTDLLVILGANPMVSNGSLCTAPDFPGRLAALQARGGHFVVVDPRRTQTADAADRHIPIRPGGDVFLLLGIIYELFAADVVELGRLEQHVDGVGGVAVAVERCSPEAMAPNCGVDAQEIRALAHEIAEAESAAVYGRLGTHAVEFGTLTSWACDVVNVLTGNLDRPGGAMFASPPWQRFTDEPIRGGGFAISSHCSRVRGLPEVMGELPSSTLADEIAVAGPGQVRALILVAGNPVRSFPNSSRIDNALASLECLVAIDHYINESTRHAHVLLPARTPLERTQFDIAFYSVAVRMVANWSDPVLDSDHPDDLDVIARLALVLAGAGPNGDPEWIHGQLLEAMLDQEMATPGSNLANCNRAAILDELAPLPPEQRIVDLLLRAGRYGDHFDHDRDGLCVDELRRHPHGIDYGPLVERLPGVLTTPSGKIDLAPEVILGDFVRLEAHRPADDQIVLIGRRDLRSNNSWMHNINVLAKGKERCTLLVHPEDAKRHQLLDGGAATITSTSGTAVAPVEITDGMAQGTVSLPHGSGHDADSAVLTIASQRPGVNSNALTDDERIDILSGNAVLNGIPVQIGPAS